MGVCLHTGGILVGGGFKAHVNRTGMKGFGKKGRW